MSKDAKSIIATKIGRFREEAHLTQTQLGIMLGFNEDSAKNRIYEYESGKRTPKIELIKKMASIFKKPIEAFYPEGEKFYKAEKEKIAVEVKEGDSELLKMMEEAKRLGVDSQIYQYINFMIGQAKKTGAVGGKSKTTSSDIDLVGRKRRKAGS